MHISGLDACREHLYTSEAELAKIFPEDICLKVIRVRALHQYILANPGARDSAIVRECTGRFGVSRTVAYSDLAIIKALLPHITQSSKDFHRWRYNEMVLQTYEMARLRGDVRTMERAAASLAKYNNIDQEQKSDIPVDKIIPQPFIATDDPSVLGIKPLPNIRDRQRALIEKYTKETADIQDISYEPADLDEDTLFSPIIPEGLPTAAQIERHATSSTVIDDT